MTETCQICHRATPPEGRRVCDACMGFDRTECSTQASEPVAGIDPSLAVCDTCGEAFAPYKLGRNFVKDGICRDCVMRKKYGPDWVPGGKSKTKERKQIYYKRYKEKKEANGGNASGLSDTAPPDKYLTIVFVGDNDEAMLARIKDIATRERRSMEQQVLYLLDGVLRRTVV